MIINKKKQRGQQAKDKQKRIDAQQAAQTKADAQQAQKEAEELQVQWKLVIQRAALSSNSTTEKEDVVVCHHGSLAKYFLIGSPFLKIAKSYVVLNKKYDYHNERHDAKNKFYNDKKIKGFYSMMNFLTLYLH